MRIAVCDDEQKFRDDIRDHIDKLYSSLDVIVDAYEDGRRLLDRFRESPYDIVFLDIEMPLMDGITVAKSLRSLSRDVYIVFLTGHVEYAVEGYEVNALRYLTKPVKEDKLLEVLRYVDERKLEQGSVRIRTDGEDLILDVSRIICLEAQNQYINICTADGDYLVRYNISDFEEELKRYNFFRVHRSYIVALSKVRKVGKAECTLDGDRVIPVSRPNMKTFKEALQRYLEKEAF